MPKLNLGSGVNPIIGYENWDVTNGHPAYPLACDDDAYDEIRASHLLEHFAFDEVPEVLKEWRRALKPGGILKVAVPDVDKIRGMIASDPKWPRYLMGGQTDERDFHRSCFTRDILAGVLRLSGFEGVEDWETDGLDTSSHPCSLNLQARKPVLASPQPVDLKVKAVMSLPRLGWNIAWGAIQSALRPFNLNVTTSSGAYWGQCMQRLFEGCVDEGMDWIIAIDYDSIFIAEHIDRLFYWLGSRPDIDAVAALQPRRGAPYPLMVQQGKKSCQIDGSPLRVDTAHFGLTVIRVESLKKCAKPWFREMPDAKGEFGEERIDSDIWFWKQWRDAGNSIYVATDVRIGHLEEMVAEFNADYKVVHHYARDYQAKFFKVTKHD